MIEYHIYKMARGTWAVGAKDPRTGQWRWLDTERVRRPSEDAVARAKDELRNDIRDEWVAEATQLLLKARHL